MSRQSSLARARELVPDQVFFFAAQLHASGRKYDVINETYKSCNHRGRTVPVRSFFHMNILTLRVIQKLYLCNILHQIPKEYRTILGLNAMPAFFYSLCPHCTSKTQVFYLNAKTIVRGPMWGRNITNPLTLLI